MVRRSTRFSAPLARAIRERDIRLRYLPVSSGGRKGPITAVELQAELEADPEWVAARDRADVERAKVVAQNGRDEAPIRRDLAALGLMVDSVADLFNRRLEYERAIPVLLGWVSRIENPDVKEDVVRALTIPAARPDAAPVMLEQLRRIGEPQEGGLTFALANALSVVAGDEQFEDLVELARDRRYGVGVRGLFVLALGNVRERRSEAIDVLLGSIGSDVSWQAIEALGQLRASQARDVIEPYVTDEDRDVRRVAQKALRRIAKQ